MLRKKLTWQLLAGYLVVMLLPLMVASWYTSVLYKKHYVGQVISSEKMNNYLISEEIAPLIGSNTFLRVDSLCKRFGREIGMRVTIILPDGRVIGDSERNPDSMENHRYRPEIVGALDSGFGTAQRQSTTLRKPMVYVASAIRADGAVVGVVRTAVPIVAIRTALHGYYGRIIIVVLVMMMVAVFLSLFLSRRFILLVRELESGAQRFARGELSAKIVLPDIDELRNLGVALNQMAAQLDERIKTITLQRNEQEAILAGMSEGVIAIDASEHVLSVNASAAALLGIDRASVAGRFLSEIIRNSALQRFAQKVLASADPLEADIMLPASGDARPSDCFLQVHGSILRGTDGVPIGGLLVMSDVTRLRKLEMIRTEFVANVSHELRTPLTAIKGFVETLQSGALDSKEDAKRFIGIIAGQVDRLTNLVDDLLTLAVIERQEEEPGTMFLEEKNIRILAQAAAKDYAAQAEAKGITISVSGDEGQVARVNPALMQQAIGNLIDNAVKYSENGKGITVDIRQDDSGLTIAVSDQGIGIPAEHRERIFERFYRVDKARSRKQGGTGLGLSIVKHVVLEHGGQVTVESEEGKGSTFTISLPKRKRTS
ncbi:MAG: ATP-binding protein [Chitinispirillaceae bacterium]|jgi:two-component system phosphate regulon sensor histidine kinase PhoR|nr:ATP-binding protein [Chitinispirillaceae bacterium]